MRFEDLNAQCQIERWLDNGFSRAETRELIRRNTLQQGMFSGWREGKTRRVLRARLRYLKRAWGSREAGG